MAKTMMKAALSTDDRSICLLSEKEIDAVSGGAITAVAGCIPIFVFDGQSVTTISPTLGPLGTPWKPFQR